MLNLDELADQIVKHLQERFPEGGKVRSTDEPWWGGYKIEWRPLKGKWMSYKISYQELLSIVDISIIIGDLDRIIDEYLKEWAKENEE